MAASLVAALNSDPHIRAQLEAGGSSASVDYKVKGAVYAEGQRAFVALQLVDAKMTKRVWSENYDYRGIGTDKMAAEIRAHVQGRAQGLARPSVDPEGWRQLREAIAESLPELILEPVADFLAPLPHRDT